MNRTEYFLTVRNTDNRLFFSTLFGELYALGFRMRSNSKPLYIYFALDHICRLFERFRGDSFFRTNH